MTPLARTVVDRLIAVYGGAADAEKAGPMRAYMRDQFAFLGIPTPRRRALSREVLVGLSRPDEDDLRTAALACWELPDREYQYFASDWLARNVGACSPGFLDTARILITTRSWWDTVDALAANVVGAIVARDRETVATMDGWLHESLWLARTAILHQVRFRERTDADRLFRYCLTMAGDPDFFIRKAIGWALREYAKSDPEAVRHFVLAHARALSPLSVREALKNLPSRGGDLRGTGRA
jgi:3-methyladenine DNA glycosylase AlkD